MSFGMKIIISWIYLLSTSVVYTRNYVLKNVYCKLNKNHVLCGDRNFHPRCGDKVVFKRYSKVDQEKFIQIHNSLRSKVAMGTLFANDTVQYPTAANMEELVWDEELAEISFGTIKRCDFNHSCRECRGSTNFKHTGENLNQMTTEEEENLQRLFDFATVDLATSGWRNEKDLFNPSELSKYPAFKNINGISSNNYGHFTQMIWANSTNIGCAKIGFINIDIKSETIIACLYGDSGNYQNEPVYKTGKPCSMCLGKGRTCSRRYPGLCDAERSFNVSHPLAGEWNSTNNSHKENSSLIESSKDRL